MTEMAENPLTAVAAAAPGGALADPVAESAPEAEPATETKKKQGGAGTLLQGGVCGEARPELMKALLKCGYTKDDKSFVVVLFHMWSGKWDGVPFGLPLSDDPTLFKDSNITLVGKDQNMSDPTFVDPWLAPQVAEFYDVVDLVAKALSEDKTVIVACVAGKNRSKAVCHALYGAMDEPKCESMIVAARGWNNDRNMQIVPLMPQRATKRVCTRTA